MGLTGERPDKPACARDERNTYHGSASAGIEAGRQIHKPVQESKIIRPSDANAAPKKRKDANGGYSPTWLFWNTIWNEFPTRSL
jgi:hypothetical protein